MRRISEWLKQPELRGQFLKYASSGLTAFGIVYIGNWIFIDRAGLDPRFGNVLATTIGYAFVYFSASKFVFKRSVSLASAGAFIAYIAIFWTLNNLFFISVYALTRWHYGVITVANMAIFFPIRFVVQRHLVFRG